MKRLLPLIFAFCIGLPVIAQVARTRNGIPNQAEGPSLPTNGLQAEFLFNENDTGGGSIAHDSSGNGYNSTAAGGGNVWVPGGVYFNTALGNGTFVVPSGVCSGAKTVYVSLNKPLLTGTTNPSYEALLADDSTANIFGYISSTWGTPTTGGGGFPGTWAVDKALGETSVAWTFPQTIYVNGKPSSYYVQQTSFAFSPTSGCKIGAYASSDYVQYTTLHTMLVWNRALSATEIAQVEAWDRAKRAYYGIYPTDINKALSPTVFIGDSITWGYGMGYGVTLTSTYPYKTSKLVNRDVGAFFPLGQVGQTTASMSNNGVPEANAITRQYVGSNPIWVVAGGTNDVTSSFTAASIVTNLTAICTAAHINGAKCVVNTTMSSTDMTGPQQTIRATLNSTVIADWLAGTNGFDWVQDWAGDPIMGNLAANSTWFADGKHPSTAGDAILAARAAEAITDVTGDGGKAHTIKVSVPYTVLNALNSGTTSQVVPLLQLGPRQVVLRVTERITTAFAATSMTALGFTVGDSGTGGTATTYDSIGSSLLAIGTHDSASVAFDSSNGVVNMTFTGTGANLNTFTAGNVDVEITTVVQP